MSDFFKPLDFNKERDLFRKRLENNNPTPDRLVWGKGEWDNETNELEFEYRSYKCQISRNPLHGFLKGYVFIPIHSLCSDPDIYYELDVHGGMTFSQEHEVNGLSFFILGFDCAHLQDLMPSETCEYHVENKRIMGEFSYTPNNLFPEKTYKNIEFVKNELMKLVDQMIEKEKNEV